MQRIAVPFKVKPAMLEICKTSWRSRAEGEGRARMQPVFLMECAGGWLMDRLRREEGRS